MQNNCLETNCNDAGAKEKISYIASNIGTAFSWGFITSYFMMFCTDAVGMPAFEFSILLLVSRLFDGITDPICGYVTDKFVTKSGRYRIWIAVFAIPVAISTCLLFYSSPAWTLVQKKIWIWAMYFIYLLMFTWFSVPLDAMASVISGSPKVRANIISLKSAAGIVGAMLMAKIAADYLYVNGTDNVSSFFNLSLIFAVISVPLYYLTPIICKERIVPKNSKKDFKIFETVKSNIKDKFFCIAFMGHFLNGLISYGRVSIFVYYFKYVAGDMAMYATFIAIMRIAQILGTYSAQYVLKLFKSTGKAISTIYVLYGVSLILNFFIVPSGSSLFLFWGLTALSSFAFGISYSLIYTIIPDIIDYSENITGKRNDGGISALLAFGNKVGMAIGTSGMGIVLSALGFTANVQQSAAVVSGINSLMFTVPGVLSVIIGAMFVSYKLKNHPNEGF